MPKLSNLDILFVTTYDINIVMHKYKHRYLCIYIYPCQL